MEVNPSKCGVMIVSPNPNIISFNEAMYNGQQLPRVKTYTYLGIEFNDSLDLKKMAKFRVNKSLSKVNSLNRTLSNISIPLEYKKMLISSIIIPSVCYESEIFGMSELRIQPLKKVINAIFNALLNSKKYCINRSIK